MLQHVCYVLMDYVLYYYHAILRAWAHLTPTGYLTLSLCVVIGGWLLMKNSR